MGCVAWRRSSIFWPKSVVFNHGRYCYVGGDLTRRHRVGIKGAGEFGRDADCEDGIEEGTQGVRRKEAEKIHQEQDFADKGMKMHQGLGGAGRC
jgi:hypothetical protein